MNEPVSEMMDRRSESRRPVGNIVAQIDCRDGDGPITGIVWDVSSQGACIFVRHQERVPDQVDLILDRTPRPALVVWRSGSHIGIRFDNVPAVSPRRGSRALVSIRQAFQGALMSVGLAGR